MGAGNGIRSGWGPQACLGGCQSLSRAVQGLGFKSWCRAELGLHGGTTLGPRSCREDTPGHCAADSVALTGQLLHPPNPLCLQLIQSLLAGQPHLIHALGVGHTQACALPTRQQQDGHLVQGDLAETWGQGVP